VLSRDTLSQLKIPANSLDKFYHEVQEKFMLVIFSPTKSCMKIEIFPVDSNVIIKLQLVLTEFTQKVFQSISSILRELNLQKLYTTGVCLRGSKCIYEAYIEQEKLTITKEELLQRFRQIENVQEVILSSID
jgi:hypothetical protein